MQIDVVEPDDTVLDRSVGVVEADLELVAAAEPLIDVVLGGRIGLIAIAPPLGAGDVIPRPDVGGTVEQRLVTAVQVRREEDLVQAEARIGLSRWV